jgi:hypothetical protein
MKANDTGLKTDVAILDFSKFDTVTHNKLLSKMDSYGIRGPINNWLNMFLPCATKEEYDPRTVPYGTGIYYYFF